MVLEIRKGLLPCSWGVAMQDQLEKVTERTFWDKKMFSILIGGMATGLIHLSNSSKFIFKMDIVCVCKLHLNKNANYVTEYWD